MLTDTQGSVCADHYETGSHTYGQHPHHSTHTKYSHNTHGPSLAAPRAVGPYTRLTSPQPTAGAARSPSPAKASGGIPFGSFPGQDLPGRDARYPGFDSTGAQQQRLPPSNRAPYMVGSGPSNSAFGQNDSSYDSFFPRSSVNGQQRPAQGPFQPGTGTDRFQGYESASSAPFPGRRDFGPATGPYSEHQSGPLSPRSMAAFQQMQSGSHQSLVAQSGVNSAQSLGSGLMTNSGQPAEEITTVFIVGFPDDMTEREFANMFLFAKGFEASTLKIPAGGLTGNLVQTGSRGPGESGSGQASAGPYVPVNVPGGSLYDLAASGGWDEQAVGMGMSRNEPFAMGNLNSTLAGSGAAPGSLAAANAAGKIKQIIGFAKFRSRAEALEARDALNGKKIDAERGCVLKTEMAKKNLHTKQRPVLSGQSGPFAETAGPGSFERQIPPPPPLGAPANFSFHPLQGNNDRHNPISGLAASFSPTEGIFPPPGASGSAFRDLAPSSRVGHGESYGSVASQPRGQPVPISGPESFRGDGQFMAEHGGRPVDTWTSMGPIDYFGPHTEEEPVRIDASASAPAPVPSTSSSNSQAQPVQSRQHRENSVGSSLSSSQPRGPDWSALGSPPGLFSTARPYVSQSVRSDGAIPETSSGSKSPTKAQCRREDFERGEPTTSPKTRGSASGSISSISSSIGGGLSPSKAITSSGRSPNAPAVDVNQAQSQTPRSSEVAPKPDATRSGTLRFDSPGQDSTIPSLNLDTKFAEAKAASMKSNSPLAPLSASSALHAASSKSPVEIPSPTSRSFSIDQNPPGNTLFVGNLPGSISNAASAALEESLRQRFQSCAGYRQLSYRVKNNGPMCFVEFDDVQNAARALAEVNGDAMNGAVKNGGLRLSFSKNPLFRNSSNGVSTVGSAAANANTATSPSLTPHFGSLGKAAESMRSEANDFDPLDSVGTLEEDSYKDGYSAGHAHGKLHGTFEGRQLGRDKGFEIWDEVGFYEGTARFWRGVLGKQVESIPAQMRSRKQVKQLQHLSALEALIAAFPTKNQSGTLAGENNAAPAPQPDSSAQSSRRSSDDQDELEDPEALAGMDMSTLLERIRARYRVVCASLGIPARGLDAPRGNETAGSPTDGKTSDGRSVPSSNNSQSTQGIRTAVIGGKVVDTTQLKF